MFRDNGVLQRTTSCDLVSSFITRAGLLLSCAVQRDIMRAVGATCSEARRDAQAAYPYIHSMYDCNHYCTYEICNLNL